MPSKEFYMVRYFGHSSVTLSGYNMERRTKLTFAKN